jgi:hypothetical protein
LTTGGPEEPRGVDHRRVEGDGVRQIGAVFHHLDHHRLPRWHVERVDEALKDAEREHVPHVALAAEEEAVVAVAERPGDRHWWTRPAI